MAEVVFCAIEQVFRRAFCVFKALFRLLKLFVSNNGIKSTIFLFSRFHQISVDVVLCQNIQNFITFMVRWEIFFPPHHEGLPWPRTWKWTRITPTNTPGTLFHVVFTSVPEILGFDFSPKNGVQNSILLISSKVLDQIKREWSHFVSNEPFLLAVFGWFPKSA